MNDAPKRRSRVQQEQPVERTAAEGAAAAERTEKSCITPFW